MAKEITLGVCSTGSRLKLAVFDGKKFYCAQRRVFNQEKPLFPMINKLLGGAGLGAVKIFCAVRGPGRFTGIRIGLTLGRVLEALAGAKIYSVTLFEVMALQAFESANFKSWAKRRQKTKIAVLMRAFKDEYFCQVFQVTSEKQPVGSPGVLESKSQEFKIQDSGFKIGKLSDSQTPRLPDSQTSTPEPSTLFKAVEEPQWLKVPEMKEYLSALGPELFVIGDAEEDPSVYTLVPAYCAKAGSGISKIIPAYLIKTALARKNRNSAPLYLKPARYELEQKAGRPVSR
ncbi:MAG: hypothetical protein A2X34_08060 [Elusimicrobia bacterium GWC2_51_8]|nr:MAG: hypothetical protein A2X33_03320 [Elusimicrobia bacterium GWA2_51_34]OGR65204.1 MAG: hypothetical protein A2X34_08060 [Elusimicrobia bacterium GWC2_51_8]OGR86032.1 MAG: hypothetical protein A2021_09830 [Elusimicrobia bacterium GWF2_52_66]HAF95626.1 hypothetical protein [Elusimicrobiota bacterium]HCE98316.1 hypothetical protein [Elusimicrobiota bacterium]